MTTPATLAAQPKPKPWAGSYLSPEGAPITREGSVVMAVDGSAGPTVIREVSKARFDAFVGYCRAPEVARLAHEVAWLGADDNSVFALIIVDLDREFSAIVFLPDLRGRFRWANQTGYFATAREAGAALEELLTRVLDDVEEQRAQGDEAGAAVDFFAPLAAEDRLHVNFRRVRDERGQSSARQLINVMMRWHGDRDGNFIEQFQTNGFDARVWELYLWATLISLGYEVTQPNPSPDFVARGLGGSFAIEATTVNPRRDQSGVVVPPYKPESEDDLPRYVDHYLPIRFAGPLTSKLGKRYWERPGISEMPLAFAVQDFHADFSMMHSIGGLMAYLYGISLHDVVDSTGRAARIDTHNWDGKQVPSRFFELPDSENVSAVIFNSQGTLPKFSRMGIEAGFQRHDVKILHGGLMLDASDNGIEQRAFSGEVEPDYWEDWITGMEVFHNPLALRPLDPTWLPGAVHHILTEEGNVQSLYPERHVVQAQTFVIELT